MDLAKPFIQLFKTPRSQYVFDVNKNEILPVSAESFSFLKQCMAGEADVERSEITEIQNLIQEGYLRSESVVQEIRHPYTPYLKYFLDRKIAKITLQVTQGCNLRCKYCIYSENINAHQRSHSNKRMSWETAKKGIDFLRAHSIDSEKVNIGFYGGEPLLEFPLIKKAVAYAKEVFDGKAISFSITTNGTMLTEEILEFLSTENVQLVISLDGPKNIHDQNRVFPDGHGSFDTVMRNVEKIKSCAPEYFNQLGFSMVMDPTNDFDCINEITFSGDSLNDHNFVAAVVEGDGFSGIASEEFVWKSEYQKFLAFMGTLGRFDSEKVSAISKSAIHASLGVLKNIKASGPLCPIDAPSGPCIPGQQRLFLSVDGRFFPCERVSETSSATCIGTLEDGFYFDKAESLLELGKLTSDICRNCWAFRHCSVCAKRADDGTSCLSPTKKLQNCKNIRADLYEKMRHFLLCDELSVYYLTEVERRRNDEM